MKPDISIIVPVYNVENYLKKCLDSIVSQSFKNIEIIIVNDGSTDNSREICDEYKKKDNRIKVIHKENEGLSSARNRGIDISKGKYIGFIDSDDWIDKYMYEKLYNLCEKTSSDIGICNFFRNENERNVEDEVVIELDNIEGMRELFKGNLYRFSACNKLFKKSCFENIIFPEGRVHEDLSTTYKVFSNANKIVYTNYLGYFYFVRENSILTSKYNEKRLDAFIGWNEILPFIKFNYENVYNSAIDCFAYYCIDNIFYILDQVKDNIDRVRYIEIIRRYIKIFYSDIKNYSKISHKQIFIIKSIKINSYILVSIYSIKYFLKIRVRKRS
ncbi:MAG: glycosyltransferase family 2 protein [Paraclostridium sp.]